MADNFNLAGFKEDKNDVCTADGGFVGVSGGQTTNYSSAGEISIEDKFCTVFAPSGPITMTLPNGINLHDSVENEFLCMRFCKAMGDDVAHVAIEDFEETRALVVARFDRK